MTDAPALRFGLFLSQASRSWAQVLDDFVMAEDLGFDHAWLVDHLIDTDGTPEDGCLESWTLLAAIAAKTERIRLGVLVTSNTFRHPALLLKEAVTVDHISGGRLILGIGTGWNEDEHRRYGIDLPAPRGARGPVRGGGPPHQPAHGPGADDVRGPLLSAPRRASRASARPAATDPDPDRRPPAADAAHRRQVRRPVGHVRGDPGGIHRRRRGRDRRADRRARRGVPGGRAGPGRRSDARPGSRARRCARPTPTSTSCDAITGSVSPTSRRSAPRPATSRCCGRSPPRSSRAAGRPAARLSRAAKDRSSDDDRSGAAGPKS